MVNQRVLNAEVWGDEEAVVVEAWARHYVKMLGTFLGCLLVTAAQAATGIAVVGADGGIDPSSLQTLRRLLVNHLGARGVTLVEDVRLEHPQNIDSGTLQLAQELNVAKIYALLPSRLGSKILLALQERDARTGGVQYEAILSARALEETDRIVPRLVNAVVDRKRVEDTAEITNVTREEAAPYQKRPGETFWAIGLPFGLTSRGTSGAFGFSLAYAYESENFRLGADALGAGANGFGALLIGLEGAYLPLSGEWSPYIAPGVGYMRLAQNGFSGGGAGFTAEIGVEFLRLHRVRILVGAEALLPAYALSSDNNTAPSTRWVPLFLIHARIAF